MKKIMILLFVFVSTLSLAACEDRKIDSDLIIVVFFTGINTDNVDTIEVEIGTTLNQLEDPTRLGYSFDGWYLDNESTIAFDYNAEINVSTTLYAKWIPSLNTITYVMDGGLNSMNNPTTFLTGQSVILSQPTRFDSTFIGWYLSPPEEINPMVDRRLTTTIGLAGDVTLYAFFEGTNHVVTFNARGFGDTYALPSDVTAPLNPRLTRIVGGTLIPELPTLSVTGFTFLGWWDSTYETQYLENTSYVLGRSATFFAKWERN